MRYVVLLALVAGCNVKVNDKSDDKDKDKVDASGEVEFSGYVQKAFTIHVNSIEFTDSEDFYTRFIAELVTPKYPTLSDSKVTVEGKYGLEEFGRSSSVFMSSESSDGHLFQATTDNQAHFSVKVKPNAQDEIYKARVVLRIGLEIAHADSTTDHFCYILHGIKDGIHISESTKPIIFDDFKTQLNTYKCEQVTDDKLVIPGTDAADDTTVVTGKDGKQTISPYVQIANTIKVPSALAADETGTNSLQGISYQPSEKKFYILKTLTKSKTDGSQYLSLSILSNLATPSMSTVKLLGLGESPYLQAAHIASLYIGIVGGSSINLSMNNEDGTHSQNVVLPQDPDENSLYRAESAFAFESGAKWKIAAGPYVNNNSYPRKICDFDAGAAKVASNCVEEPKTNPTTPTGQVKSGTFLKDAVYYFFQSSDDTKSWYIEKQNLALVHQQTYSVSKLLMSPTEMSVAHLVADDSNLYLVSLIDGQLNFRQLSLVE